MKLLIIEVVCKIADDENFDCLLRVIVLRVPTDRESTLVSLVSVEMRHRWFNESTIRCVDARYEVLHDCNVLRRHLNISCRDTELLRATLKSMHNLSLYGGSDRHMR